MRRLLVAAPDRDLTRFVAESLLERSVDAPPKTDDAWDIARAHTALEAKLLVTHGGRPFDAAVVDQGLGPDDVLALMETLSELSASPVPIYVLTERGRDRHVRRVATERHIIAGFIDKPVTAEGLREVLGTIARRKRVLLVEPDADRAEGFERRLARAGYTLQREATGREALDRAARFRPDAVAAAVNLPDLRGPELCQALKRAQRGLALPVVLYGQVADLGPHGIEENAERADDFVPAPFDEDVLVERIAQLIGVGPGGKLRRRRRSVLDQLPTADLSSEQPTLSDLKPVTADDDEDTGRGPAPEAAPARATYEGQAPVEVGEASPTPPPSASPAAVSPTRRSTRRVPCNTAMAVRNGEKVYRSRTLDISHGGIFLATDEPLEIGERIDMAFKLPESAETIRAIGKVCWLGRGGLEHARGVGVKFSKIDPDDLQAIVAYVNRVARVIYSASE